MHYVVEVRADNAIGAGASSTPQTATPAGLPGSPTNVAAVSNTTSADVSWTAPSDDGGAPITGYTATAYSSVSSTTPIKTCTTASTACSITGLVNGTAYYVSFFFQAEDGIRDADVTGVQTCALPISRPPRSRLFQQPPWWPPPCRGPRSSSG